SVTYQLRPGLSTLGAIEHDDIQSRSNGQTILEVDTRRTELNASGVANSTDRALHRRGRAKGRQASVRIVAHDEQRHHRREAAREVSSRRHVVRLRQRRTRLEP